MKKFVIITVLMAMVSTTNSQIIITDINRGKTNRGNVYDIISKKYYKRGDTIKVTSTEELLKRIKIDSGCYISYCINGNLFTYPPVSGKKFNPETSVKGIAGRISSVVDLNDFFTGSTCWLINETFLELSWSGTDYIFDNKHYIEIQYNYKNNKISKKVSDSEKIYLTEDLFTIEKNGIKERINSAEATDFVLKYYNDGAYKTIRDEKREISSITDIIFIADYYNFLVKIGIEEQAAIKIIMDKCLDKDLIKINKNLKTDQDVEKWLKKELKIE